MSPDSLIANWGYLGIVVFLVLTGCGLPIPEEVPIIAAGVLAGEKSLNPWLALGSCFVGAIVGDVIMYGIGRKFGRTILQRHSFFAKLLSAEREHEMEEKFRLHGLKVLFVARFLVGIRSPIYITAGILKVPLKRFVLVDLFCAAVMISTFFGVAFLFSNQVRRWFEYLQKAEAALTITLLIGAAAAFVVYRIYRRRHARKAAEDAAAAKKAESETNVERSVA